MYDVIIVGAGPAGSTCAWFASQAKRRVLLLDAATFPREKTCGDAMTRIKTMGVLRQMGLDQEFSHLATGHCEIGVLVAPNGARLLIPAPSGSDPLRRATQMCRRREFDAWLLSKVKPHVEVREGLAVHRLERRQDRWEVHATDPRTGCQHTFDGVLVVGADGAHSVVARESALMVGERRQMGVALRGYFKDVPLQSDRLELYFLAYPLPGYLWIFPCGDGTANVGLAVYRRNLDHAAGGLATVFWDLVKRHPLLSERFRSATLVGTLAGWPLPLWSRRRTLSGNGVLLIGDAAWLIDPITAEGIGNAMVSAQLAADVLDEALTAADTSATFLHRYDQRLWQAIGGELRLARLLQQVVNSKWATNAMFSLAQFNPVFTQVLLAIFLAPRGKRSVFSLREFFASLKTQRHSDPKAVS